MEKAESHIVKTSLRFLAGVATVVLCVAAIATRAADDIKFIALVRFTVDTEKEDLGDRYYSQLKKGGLKYDGVRYWSPSKPEGSVPMGCDVRVIGVTYTVTRPRREPVAQRVIVRNEWLLSGETVPCLDCAWDREVKIYPGRRTQLASIGMSLRDKWIVDGTYRMKVFVEGNAVFETSFERKDCGRPVEARRAVDETNVRV